MMTFAAHAALQRMSDLMKRRIPGGVIAMEIGVDQIP
jgi:hypothetical protein